MHNPVTNSGGVLLGRVAQIGTALKSKYPSLRLGTEIIPLSSLSCLPLLLSSIGKIDGDQVEVVGKASMEPRRSESFTPDSHRAVVNGLIVPVAVPADMSPNMVRRIYF